MIPVPFRHLTIQILLFSVITVFVSPTFAGVLKLGRSCGCQVGAYTVYGAGEEICQIYALEYERNSESNEIDASFGQSVGWIAGFMSASNRSDEDRDIFDVTLEYMAYKVAEWCAINPQKTLADAVEALVPEVKEK